ncbi:unnamed protein product [Protopolystoma xenopodis]|uniref:Uncharacterized protein n=1 Tax=Protopolystoma xenopodis TaxID=117903 RepID=A0A3S5FG53_9PLAT|nr:unnamed protein product [Protopolystoma xenopodis]
MHYGPPILRSINIVRECLTLLDTPSTALLHFLAMIVFHVMLDTEAYHVSGLGSARINWPPFSFAPARK